MHVGVLAQIDPCQVESEYVDGAAQCLEPAARERHRTVGGKGAVEDCQVDGEVAGVQVGWRLTYGVMGCLETIEGPGRGSEAGIDPGNSAPVGLVAAIGRLVG